MNEADALEVLQAAIWTIIVGSGPAVGVAMVVGTGIALLQALTQVQELTLTFVPKIVAILVVIYFTGSFMGAQVYQFTLLAYSRIETGF